MTGLQKEKGGRMDKVIQIIHLIGDVYSAVRDGKITEEELDRIIEDLKGLLEAK